MKWGQAKLSEIADVQVGFAFPSKDFVEAENAGVLLLRGDNLQQGFIRWGDKAKKWADAEDKKLEKYFLGKNDVVLAMDRPIVSGGLKISKILDQDLPCYLVQRVMRLRGSCDVDTSYIFHLLRSNQFIAYIERITTGANIPHISHKEVIEYSFELPPLSIREKIASTLSNYDDLIQTNHQRIALLEEAAQRLYDEWFVKLRFPNYEQIPVVDGVPEGWAVKSLDEIAEIIMGQSPESKHYNSDGEGLPFHQGVSDFNDRFVTNRIYTTQSTRSANLGDILCSVRAPVGRLNITLDNIAIGRGLSAFRSPQGLQSLLFYQLGQVFKVEDSIGSGSIFNAVNKKELYAQTVIFPSRDLANQFENIVKKWDEQIQQLFLQNQKLIQARDELLPRLMSGQLDVSKLTLAKVA